MANSLSKRVKALEARLPSISMLEDLDGLSDAQLVSIAFPGVPVDVVYRAIDALPIVPGKPFTHAALLAAIEGEMNAQHT
ncbi:hypothetical protein E4K72_02975 [Oxalobacteraceae bacterium OM1]|nr:hypothetical protein E4K72_02975 [Oxalobacteraceae bacterium OM1]